MHLSRWYLRVEDHGNPFGSQRGVIHCPALRRGEGVAVILAVNVAFKRVIDAAFGEFIGGVGRLQQGQAGRQ